MMILLAGVILSETEDVLDGDPLDLIITRSNLATSVGQCGDVREALRMFRELQLYTEFQLERDDTVALKVRNNVAYWTARCGDLAGALALFDGLLTDQERVLGRNHPETLSTIGSIGVYKIRVGDSVGGCEQLRAGLERAKARFGSDHELVRQFERSIQRGGCR